MIRGGGGSGVGPWFKVLSGGSKSYCSLHSREGVK